MSSSAALFQILYQNETLFRLEKEYAEPISSTTELQPATDTATSVAVAPIAATPNIATPPIAAPPTIPAPNPLTPVPASSADSAPDITPPQPAAKPAFTTPAITPTQILPPIAVFPTLQHRILILIDQPKQKDIAASESVFLDNILKAVGHSVDEADILNYNFLKGPDARKVLSEKQTNFFITFGVPLIKLHLDLLLMPYTPKVVEGVWFLLTDPLHVIEADRSLKKKLWQALKQMFEMS